MITDNILIKIIYMKIIVLNLPRSINVKDLENIFKPYGNVINCNIVLDNETGKSKGFGFAEMTTEIEAKNAIEKLHGSLLINKKIRVKVSNKK